MEKRQLTPLDRLLASANNALRTVAAPAGHTARPNPARHIVDADLSEREKRHAAGLMRVNHAGEICAQALYQGHAAVARDKSVEAGMQRAADEEFDHLAWCEQRINELGEDVSKLSPFWYAGAFAIGAVIVIADQITKLWARTALDDGPIDIIPGVLRFRLTENPGSVYDEVVVAVGYTVRFADREDRELGVIRLEGSKQVEAAMKAQKDAEEAFREILADTFAGLTKSTDFNRILKELE